MQLMGSRHEQLQWTLAGLEKAGIPLVATDGTRWMPSGGADDLGIYYIVPKLAAWFHLSLDQSINLFFHGMIAFSALLALTGAFLLFKKSASRIYAGIMILALSLLPYHRGDVYTVLMCVNLAGAPLALWLIKKVTGIRLMAGSLILGLTIGLAHILRAHAGTGLLLFAAILIAWECREKRARKMAAMGAMVIGLLLPHLLFTRVIRQRNAFLQDKMEAGMSLNRRHPIWHSVYVGLAFLSNPYIPAGGDQVVHDAVKKIDPTVQHFSDQSEKILLRLTLNFARQHPYFMLRTLAAKSGVLLMFLLLAMNIGVWGALRFRQSMGVELAFLAALGWNSLFGLLVEPYHFYMLGFMAFASVYGWLAFNRATTNLPS